MGNEKSNYFRKRTCRLFTFRLLQNINGTIGPNPDFWGALLFNELMYGNVVQTTNSYGTGLHQYVTHVDYQGTVLFLREFMFLTVSQDNQTLSYRIIRKTSYSTLDYFKLGQLLIKSHPKGTVRDPKVSHFFHHKTLEKWDTLGTFTQKVPFLDYNKPKKEKSGTLYCVTLWGHGLYFELNVG